ncbi:MAG: tetratricopeptide repeat protein [Treponema sp.]|nr:tetratricopeptide repeat protein [Treponema sp.]
MIFCFAFVPPVFLEAQTAPGTAFYYEQGRAAMIGEDWYAAAESFIECLRLNGAHAEAAAALAECYYELGEFDEALIQIRRARVLARGSMTAANLEASILIALGRLDAAASVIADVLVREPYNREALFAAAELDVARGRTGDAMLRVREAVRRYADYRRLLISLALVSASLGDNDAARSSMERALREHPGDYRVYYYAAYIDAQGGRVLQAIRYAEQALFYKPGYGPARSLLAGLRYRTGRYEEAARLADESIAADREDLRAWYLKGLAYGRMGRSADAIGVLSGAAAIRPDDEFVRASLEELLIGSTGVEDPSRRRWAAWHFDRARDFRKRHLAGEALFEYRRGLRLNPYAADRREYAELLRLQGYPGRYLEELRFMQDLGLGDRSVDDAVEAYDALLSNALYRRWQVDPVDAVERHWKLAVFFIASWSGSYHTDAGATAASCVRELLVHDRNIVPLELELRQPSFSSAYRSAREGGADYFMVIRVSENERDLSLRGELFAGRTGSAVGTFYAYRTGGDRLRNACRNIVDQFAASLPFRGKLLARRQAQGLIDKGRADGVKNGTVYDVVKRGQPVILSEGIGLSYTAGDLVGTITIEDAGEELSAGTLSRNGFFDRIGEGDEVIMRAEEDKAGTPPENAVNPELRTLLRALR